jgi:hypothetical protein
VAHSVLGDDGVNRVTPAISGHDGGIPRGLAWIPRWRPAASGDVANRLDADAGALSDRGYRFVGAVQRQNQTVTCRAARHRLVVVVMTHCDP